MRGGSEPGGCQNARTFEKTSSGIDRVSKMRVILSSSEDSILIVRTCLANSLTRLGRNEQASNMLRDVYSARVRLNGDEHEDTIVAALNYAASLGSLRRVKEAKSLLRKTVPVARRVLGEVHDLTLTMRWLHANILYMNDSATVDDHREAVETLESVAISYKRILGASHPETQKVQNALATAREKLADARASEAKPPP